MKTTFTQLINHRTLTTINPVDKELKIQSKKNYLFDLSYTDVIDISGDKALDFLQGQLPCGVQSISDIQIIQGAQCNLKGRILALMDVINWNGIKLVLPQDLEEATISSLSRTAMLSRVTLKKNQELRVLGLYLQNPADMVPESTFFPNNLYALTYSEQYCSYDLGQGFYVFLAQPEFVEKVQQQFAAKDQLLGSLTWHTLRLKHKQITIYPESRGLFLPHKLDLHQTPYLSFNKGCYKGQEIIARMHYKATLKYELNIYSIKTDELIYSGQKLFKKCGETEIGEVVDFSILGDGHYLVALSLLKGIEPLVLLEGQNKLVPLEQISH